MFQEFFWNLLFSIGINSLIFECMVNSAACINNDRKIKWNILCFSGGAYSKYISGNNEVRANVSQLIISAIYLKWLIAQITTKCILLKRFNLFTAYRLYLFTNLEIKIFAQIIHQYLFHCRSIKFLKGSYVTHGRNLVGHGGPVAHTF